MLTSPKLTQIALLTLLAIMLPSLAEAKTYAIKGFVGTSSTDPLVGAEVLLLAADTGETLARTKTDMFGGYRFKKLNPGTYLVQVNQYRQSAEIVKKNVRVMFDLSNPNGTLDYGKDLLQQAVRVLGDATGQSAGGPSQGGAPGGNAALARQIAGTWWGYAGSTETRIGLCPNGIYRQYSESGYSGSSHDMTGAETMAWGTASQSGAAGNWSITGNTRHGTISIRYQDGSMYNMTYEQAGEAGCLVFDGGNTLCRTSATCN